MTEVRVLKNLSQQHVLLTTAFNNAKTAANDIIEAVRLRIRSDKEQAAARIVELNEIINDPDSSEITVHLAMKEKTKLSEREFTATDDEQEAFYSEIEKANTVLQELREVRDEFSSVYNAAASAMQTTRAAIMGSSLYDLAPRWINGLTDDFERLM